jgi:uncharacterized membrane protein YedE/YeeE
MARRLLAALLPPPSSADPRATLRWVRRLEIVTGLLVIAGAVLLSGTGGWRWLLIGVGLLGLSPWPGPAAILRRADRKPGVLVTDAERRRARGRRVLRVLVPVYIAIALGVGYLIDGWPAAITAGLLVGIGAGLGAWLVVRREGSTGRARPD